MKKWITVLGGLLALQLVLAVALHRAGENFDAFEPTERLLAFEHEAIDGVRIEDSRNQVLLVRRDGGWLLPKSNDFPAEEKAVQGLLVKLADLKKGWPVATSTGAVERFKVAPETFERRLTLLSGDKTVATLYLGTSRGFRKVHVRPEGDHAVYAVAFNAWETNADVDDWIDKDVLKIPQDEIERIEMADIVLQRDEEILQLAGLAEDEMPREDAVRAFVGGLTGLRVQSLLGTEDAPAYGLNEPSLEIRLLKKGGDTLTYRFAQPKDAGHYVLKRSDLDYYFQVTEFTVAQLKDTGREKLVQIRNDGPPKGGPDGQALAKTGGATKVENSERNR